MIGAAIPTSALRDVAGAALPEPLKAEIDPLKALVIANTKGPPKLKTAPSITPNMGMMGVAVADPTRQTR